MDGKSGRRSKSMARLRRYTDVRSNGRNVITSKYSSPSTSEYPHGDPSRAVFTHLPGSGDANFMPMLLSHNVIVNTLPVAQSPIWMGLLWRFVPLLFFGLILLLVIAPKNSMRSNRAMDDRVT